MSGSDDVRQWIRNERSARTGTLVIAGAAIETLPMNLFELDHLEHLTITKTELTHLPSAVSRLSRLRSLRLYRNALTKVPRELGALTHLQFLDLEDNLLESLPDEICNLRNLRLLRLARNRLRELPEGLGKLTHLALLELSDNQLVRIPHSTLGLGNLTHCYLHGNAGLQIPDKKLGLRINELPMYPMDVVPTQRMLGEYFRSRVETSESEKLESHARSLLRDSSVSLGDALRSFFEARSQSTHPETLDSEFGFLLKPQESETGVMSAEWRRSVWRILARQNDTKVRYVARNADEGPRVDTEYTADTSALGKDRSAPSIARSDRARPSSLNPADEGRSPSVSSHRSPRHEETAPNAQKKGDILESATLALFKKFFEVGQESEEKILQKLRRQQAGTQHGRDLDLEFICDLHAVTKVKCRVECKNIRDNITPVHVVTKVLECKASTSDIDHWILISPHANPSNILNEILDDLRDDPFLPFTIQIWCPETGIEDFFALSKSLFDLVYGPSRTHRDIELPIGHTRKTIETFSSRLSPKLRLSRAMREYISNPVHLCLRDELHPQMDALHRDHLPLYAKTTDGVLLANKTLEQYFCEWLLSTVSSTHLIASTTPTMILLGEFGDGKSAFTYLMSRRLIEGYRESPTEGWFPLRIALKELSTHDATHSLVERRLALFGASLRDFELLRQSGRVVIFLDGFDEMSRRMDPASTSNNIALLRNFFGHVAGCRVVITSRMHVFEHTRERERLLGWLGDPPVYQLARLSRGAVKRHLSKRESQTGVDHGLLRRLESMNDPIGLATKPLFLQFVKDTIRHLPSDLSVLSLYATYVDRTLRRKIEFLEPDQQYILPPDEIVERLVSLMEDIAYAIQSSKFESVSLEDWCHDQRADFAELLWSTSARDGSADGEQSPTDAMSRVGARSLLSRHPGAEEGAWHVDFCHRSMREYFVARSIVRRVRDGGTEACSLIEHAQPSIESLHFAALILREEGIAIAQRSLLLMLARCKIEFEPDYRNLGGYLITILLQISGQLPNGDYTSLRLDRCYLSNANLSRMDFSGSSFVDARLDNVTFEHANFCNTDLSGVRLEETASVCSLLPLNSDSFLASYDDGTIRRWELTGGKNGVETVFDDPAGRKFALSLQPTGEIAALTEDDALFFDWTRGQLSVVSTFSVRQDLVMAELRDERVLWLRRGNGFLSSGDGLLSCIEDVDLEDTTSLRPDIQRPYSIVDSLGKRGFVACELGEGLTVSVRASRAGWLRTTLYKGTLNAVRAVPLEDNEYLIAGGLDSGLLLLWHVDVGEDVRVLQQTSYGVRESSVRCVAFLDARRVLVGHADGSVDAVSISIRTEDGMGVAATHPLRLSLRCEGMEIDGLQGTKEYDFLAGLISRTQTT